MQLPRLSIAPLVPVVQPGDVAMVGPICVVPLHRSGREARQSGLVPMARALAEGAAQVEELERPQVPTLRCLNRGAAPIFALAGEELRGGRQDRVANVSVVLPPGAAVELPVSCVERGRWAAGSGGFVSEGRTLTTTGRASLCRSVSQSVVSRGGRESDQGQVWAEVDRCSTQVGTRSMTSALVGAFAAGAEQIEHAVETLARRMGNDEQVGMVLYQDGCFTGLDLFADPTLCAHYVPALVRGAALDALAAGLALDRPPSRPAGAGGAPDADRLARRAARFLTRFSSCTRGVSLPAVGLGQELRLLAAGYAGSALLVNSELVHLAVYGALGASSPSMLATSLCPGSGPEVAALLLEVRGQRPARVGLPAGSFTIGRASECDVQVLHPRVSRQHLQIEVNAEGSVHVRDAGSLNGTRRQGERLEGRQLMRPADVVHLGTSEVRLILLDRC